MKKNKLRILALVSSFSNEGSMFTETLMKIGIVIIVGGVLISVLDTLIPDLFRDVIAKIRTVFEITG